VGAVRVPAPSGDLHARPPGRIPTHANNPTHEGAPMSPSPVRRLVGLAAILIVTPLTAAAVAAVGTASPWSVPAAAAPAHTTANRAAVRPPLVISISVRGVGHVLATRGRMPLYTFGPERKDHKIHCVGSCATVWPPVIVPAGTRVPAHIARLSGTFGTIARTRHSRQLTRNHVPLYTFEFDSPGHVTGDGTSGFSVARA
jgi:predicted lipoprotein with Yx(FWY)xxD motif